MSSKISTEPEVRLKADSAIKPWQFFVLAGLGCATAATFMARGQGITAILLLSVLMAAVTFVGVTALRAIKELEFDRAIGKLSEEDFKEMSGRLRARATRLIRQLDAGGGYREQI